MEGPLSDAHSSVISQHSVRVLKSRFTAPVKEIYQISANVLTGTTEQHIAWLAIHSAFIISVLVAWW